VRFSRLSNRDAARAALAGSLAAAVWAAQQPLDKRVFRFGFDDVELLGKAVTRGPRWRLVGTAPPAVRDGSRRVRAALARQRRR
jgi:hypothetical protein